MRDHFRLTRHEGRAATADRRCVLALCRRVGTRVPNVRSGTHVGEHICSRGSPGDPSVGCRLLAEQFSGLLTTVVVASRPVRRILYRALRPGDGHPSRPAIARRLLRPTRGSGGRAAHPLCSALLRVGFVEPPGSPRRWCALTAPFHPYLCGPSPRAGAAIGGLFSVALSCGSPRLGVTQHPALWSPDVPRPGHLSGPDAAIRPTRHRRHCRGSGRRVAADRSTRRRARPIVHGRGRRQRAGPHGRVSHGIHQVAGGRPL